MGASQSVSHFAHRYRDDEGRRHRLVHVDSNEEAAHPCGMCSQDTQAGAEVYRCRCRRCPFVLHADCYNRPEKIHDHFLHAHPGHTLELTMISSRGQHQQCNICAVDFDVGGGRPSYFVYGCGKCRGFYAHPRCAALPPTLDHALHPHKLTLLSPPRWGGRGHGNGRRRCINAAGNCQNASRLTNNARSYQCNSCRVELCLACQLPQPDGGAAVPERNGGGEDPVGCAHQVGATIGTFFYAMGFACLGVQTQRPSAAG